MVARKLPYPKISIPANDDISSRSERQTEPAPGADSRIAQLYKEKAELEERLEKAEMQLRLAAESRWLKLGRKMGLGPILEQEK